MCGIVGLFLKDEKLGPRLGELFAPMLVCMTGRGPDSAGFAIYGDEVSEGSLKVTLRAEHSATGSTAHDWKRTADAIGKALGCQPDLLVNANYAVLKVKASEEALRHAVAQVGSDLHIMSV